MKKNKQSRETGSILEQVDDVVVKSIWSESIDAELEGDISQALSIHEQILSAIGPSYPVYLRAGWLHYKAGGYRRALEFYEKAAGFSPNAVVPSFGAMDCRVAMGDSIKVASHLNTIPMSGKTNRQTLCKWD